MAITKITIDGTDYEVRAIPNQPSITPASSSIHDREGRDWEIVEMVSEHIGPHKPQDGCEACTIHSVLRKSDGVVFTVGDRHSGTSYKDRAIESFNISGNEMFIHQTGGSTRLSDAQPLPQRTKLFTTEDGVDIFEGDKYWYLENWKGKKGIADKLHSGAFPTFSTEESVNEYILLNKPILILNDVLKITRTIHDGAYGKDIKNYLNDELKQLAKSKIGG